MKSYFRHKIEDLIVVSEIITVHDFEFGEKFGFPGEAHDFWELVFCDRGKISCNVDGRKVELRPGEMLFHAPLSTHTLETSGAARVLIAAFACGSEAMSFFAGKKVVLGAANVQLIYGIIDEGKATFDLSADDPKVTKLELRPDSVLGGKQMIKDLLEMLLVRLLRNANGQTSGPVFLRKNDVDNRLAERVKEFLAAHVNGKLTMDDVCAEVNYCKTYVFDRFRRATGMSVMRYFTYIKIAEAERLLVATDKTVSEIADCLWFDTADYFTKTFRRVTGKTPTRWRKDALSAAPPSGA